MIEEYLLDTGWTCGLIICKKKIIIDSAPIFRKFIGMDITTLKYKVYRLGGKNVNKISG